MRNGRGRKIDVDIADETAAPSASSTAAECIGEGIVESNAKAAADSSSRSDDGSEERKRGGKAGAADAGRADGGGGEAPRMRKDLGDE